MHYTQLVPCSILQSVSLALQGSTSVFLTGILGAVDVSAVEYNTSLCPGKFWRELLISLRGRFNPDNSGWGSMPGAAPKLTAGCSSPAHAEIGYWYITIIIIKIILKSPNSSSIIFLQRFDYFDLQLDSSDMSTVQSWHDQDDGICRYVNVQTKGRVQKK